MESPPFIAPARVIAAIPIVGIPGVTAGKGGHPAVGQDLSKGIFAECAGSQQPGERNKGDF